MKFLKGANLDVKVMIVTMPFAVTIGPFLPFYVKNGGQTSVDRINAATYAGTAQNPINSTCAEFKKVADLCKTNEPLLSSRGVDCKKALANFKPQGPQ